MVFGCVLENTIENTFSTCCTHFLTFSQLSNKYIISFLNIETQKKQNLEKKIHQIRSYRNTKETKPKKKKIQQIAQRRRDWAALKSIFAWSVLVWICTGAGRRWCGTVRRDRSVVVGLELDLRIDLGSLSLSLRVSPEMVWSENFHFKPFPGQTN